MAPAVDSDITADVCWTPPTDGAFRPAQPLHRPLKWTAAAKDILAKAKRAEMALASAAR